MYSDLLVSVLVCSFLKGYLEEMQNLLHEQLKQYHLPREGFPFEMGPGTMGLPTPKTFCSAAYSEWKLNKYLKIVFFLQDAFPKEGLRELCLGSGWYLWGVLLNSPQSHDFYMVSN